MLKLQLMETAFLQRAKSVRPWMPAEYLQSFSIITVSTTTFIPEISYRVCGIWGSSGVFFSVLYQIINQNFSHSLLWELQFCETVGGRLRNSPEKGLLITLSWTDEIPLQASFDHLHYTAQQAHQLGANISAIAETLISRREKNCIPLS